MSGEVRRTGSEDQCGFDMREFEPVTRRVPHHFPCVDTATCDRCEAHRQRMKDALAELMADQKRRARVAQTFRPTGTR